MLFVKNGNGWVIVFVKLYWDKSQNFAQTLINLVSPSNLYQKAKWMNKPKGSTALKTVIFRTKDFTKAINYP